MNTLDVVLTLHEAISFTLKSMNNVPESEVQNLREAIESAKKALEMLESNLAEAEKKLNSSPPPSHNQE